MTTRLELRAAVRRLLEDEGATPLWDDATLNGFLADAMRRYGTRVPVERSEVVAVAAGDLAIPVAALRVARAIDPAGETVPRSEWRWWDGAIRLATPAAGGDWRVEHLAGRELPGDDPTAVEIEPGDEGIVTVLAAASALRRRAVEDGKRGLTRGGAVTLATADAFEREAETLFAARLRRVQGGYLRG